MNTRWVVVACLVGVLSGCGLEAVPGIPGGSDAVPGATCGPGNCTGCCNNGVCMAGTAAEACGSGGAICGTCASHQACMAQACGMDLNQVWFLAPLSAVIAPTNNGATWDDIGGAAPDPYVVIGGVSTAEAADTYEPAWNDRFEVKAADLMAGLTFQVMDSDAFNNDSITPAQVFQLNEASFQAGGFELTNWGGVLSIQFTLSKKQP